jgi:phage gp29-like protein
VHTHKAKGGYLERSALFRVLLWPYLFKNYSVGDLAEFLEIYGIQMRLGKYPTGATEKEKLTLMRALAQIGHNAAGIIPRGMELEFHDAAQGDPAAFKLMIEWCEKTQSKAILGGTLTSQADGASSTNALGNVHNEVRKELTVSDSKQIAKTINRDLIYPIAALNGLADNFARSPRLKFDTNEPEDMQAMSTALPVFVDMGMRIGRQWAQERAGIPEPDEDEEVLMPSTKPAPPELGARAALNQQMPVQALTPVPQQMLEQTRTLLEPATNAWINKVRELLATVNSLEELQEKLVELYPSLTLDEYADAMATATTAAQLAGRNEVVEEK